MMGGEASCGLCRYWQSEGGAFGECRRHPPVILEKWLPSLGAKDVEADGNIDFATRWPVTGLGEFCGEFADGIPIP